MRVNPTGEAVAKWRERTGPQRLVVTIDPHVQPDSQVRIRGERRWGHEVGDTSREELRSMPREGAEALRDALTAILEWTPDADG